VSLEDFNNERQPEVASKTGNTYISATVTYSVEISTAHSGYLTMTNSTKVSPSDCDNDGQPEMAKIGAQSGYIAISGCQSLAQLPEDRLLFSSTTWSKHPDMLLEFCHSSRDLNISGFGGPIATSGYRSLSQSLGAIFAKLTMVDNTRFAVGISSYLS